MRAELDLPNGEVIELNVDEFLRFEPVVAFTNSLQKLVEKAASAVAGDERKIIFVATGGGARLPMVQGIAEQLISRDPKQFQRVSPMPYPDLVDPYPQIAVAVGGALPILPEQRNSVLTHPDMSWRLATNHDQQRRADDDKYD